jgi:hypothetical protein
MVDLDNKLEDESDIKLAAKLEKARKEKETKEAETMASVVGETDLPDDAPEAEEMDEKELLYSSLEKLGCSKSYLVKMKERHGTVIVYPHEDGKWFVVRPLRVREMKMIREIAGQDAEKLNRELLEAGCVFPMLSEEAISDLPAGLPDLLVNMISRLSAFIPVELAFSLSKEL